MNQVIKKFIGFSVGPVLGAFIAFITIPLTTHFVHPDEYGKASMFLLLQMVLASFLYLGLDQSYTREYHSSKNKLHLFQQAILIPLAIAVLILLISIIFSRQISVWLFSSPNHIIPVILIGVMVVFMVIERFILLSIRMEEKALEYSLLNIFVKLFMLILTLIFVLFIRRDFLAVVYSTIFGQILGDLYLVIRYRYLFSFNHFSVDKDMLRKMVIFGLPLVVATSLTGLLNSLDRIFLRIWSDYYNIGIFTATLKIAGTLAIIKTSFTSYWVPMAYRWHEEGKELKYYKLMSDSILLFMSIVFFGILIFKDFIAAILSSGYSDSKYLIAFLCLQPIMYTVSETTCLGIVFSRKSYLNIWVSVVSVIPNLILNILLVPKFGATGAAIATSVSYLCFFIARTYFSNKNGMKFSTVKHHLVFCILLVSAVLNVFHLNYIILFTILLMVIALLIQASTIKELLKVKSGVREADPIAIKLEKK
ncbi:oligosaccharide flippase family protein [Niallia sp. 01092]|uniref:oligosaccharide flippase family protein n=1 Tax=unclassified Niallia TaxID=2837522 RepID=UPI003FD19B73